MKIKIVAVKYFDWVMLGALGLLLIFSLFKNFVVQDRTLDELSSEIDRYDRTVKEAMRSTEVHVKAPTDFLGDLRRRFDHLLVISPYRRNPFVLPVDVEMGMVQIPKGTKKEILVKDARITDLLTPSPLVHVVLNYKPDDGNTVVEITGVEKGNVLLRLRADTEQTYRVQVNVLKIDVAPEPFPPRDVAFAARGPIVKGSVRRARPLVLIAFYPDNPPLSDVDHGQTTGAWIERKLADAPDVEYVRVNQKPLRLIKKREEATDMWRRFQPEEAAATPAAGAPAAPAAGPVVPEVAPEVITPTTGRTGAVQAAPLIVPGCFAFLDDSVDEGESYLYRITTINEVESLAPASCKPPFVSASAINVPALVQISVVSIGQDGSAVLNLTAPSPDGGAPATQRFTVKPGMAIGAKVRTRITSGTAAPTPGGVAIPAAGMVKDIDFSTGCILVAALPAYKEIDCRPKLRGTKVQYQVRLSNGAQILYLTPGGVLRWKGKEQAAASPTPGAMPGMGAPGAPERP